MGWAMTRTEDGNPVESDQGKDVYTTSNYVFAQLLDYYGMVKESKDVYKHMDRVVFDYGNSMITPDNLRAELEQERKRHPGNALHCCRLSPAGRGMDAPCHAAHLRDLQAQKGATIIDSKSLMSFLSELLKED